MATHFGDIQSVLYATAALIESAGLSVQYDNTEYTPSPNTGWARVTIIPASAEAVTMGAGGENEHLGLFVIDLFAPAGDGSGNIIFVSDVYNSTYGIGYSGVKNSTIVQFISVNRSVGSVEDGFYKVSVTIRYRARAYRD